MQTQRHLLQMRLLMETLEAHRVDRDDVFIGGDMFAYFSELQTKTHDFRGPDFFLVTGTTRRERKAWLVWAEGMGPDVVIELLSDTTAHLDRGVKKDQYARMLRVPEYFIYDPFTGELEGWDLRAVSGGLWSVFADLELRVWRGTYAHVEAPWLRWYTKDGELLLTGLEQADAEARTRVEAERRIRELEQRLAARGEH